MKKGTGSIFLALMLAFLSAKVPAFASEAVMPEKAGIVNGDFSFSDGEEQNSEEDDWKEDDPAVLDQETDFEQLPVYEAEELENQETEIASESPPEENPGDEFKVALLTEEEADFLEAETPEDQEFLEELQSGEVIAFAPVPEEIITEETAAVSAAALEADKEPEAFTTAALSRNQYVITSSRHVYCDEFWTKENVANAVCNDTLYRSIQYIDSEGKEVTTPLFCMNPKKLGINPGASGEALKEAAYKLMQNSNLKKILYFGYGGPGTITKQYDPTCSHIDWSKTDNRYFFTHMALSIEYANDYNFATKAQAEHMGVLRWLNKLKSKSLPSRTGVVVRAPNASGTLIDANPASAYLKYYRTKPETGWQWLDSSFWNGFQISRMCTVKDQEGIDNGITVTRKTTDNWQMIYWVNNQAVLDNPDNPTVLAKGKSVTLKNGYKFKFIFPKSVAGTVKLTFPMLLAPVQYLIVDGDKQTGSSGYQDFGAYVYQNGKGSVTISFTPQEVGSILLKKTSTADGTAVANAVYSLYAAEDIFSAAEKVYAKNKLVAEGKTDSAGQIQFQELLPGRYYIREKTAAPGFLLDTAEYSCAVSAGIQTDIEVKDIPDMQGGVSIRKTAEGTGQILEDAEFTLYEWKQSADKYVLSGKLRYESSREQYVSGPLSYSEENQGKFLVKETKNPSGYTGSWEQEFILTEEERYFFYEVTNQPTSLLTGSVTVVKKIRAGDITWAHGNPVFGFVLEGTDEKGISRKYEDHIVFTPGSCNTGADGYAGLDFTFTNVPLGTYVIYEKPVLRYYLKDVQANTGNVAVHREGTPAYGLLPKETAYARAVLNADQTRASVTFINEKKRYDDYSHNCIIENNVPIVFKEQE